MARPRTYTEPRRLTAVRLPVALHDRLRAEADARLVSVNLLVERAVEQLLERLGPDPATPSSLAGDGAIRPSTGRAAEAR